MFLPTTFAPSHLPEWSSCNVHSIVLSLNLKPRGLLHPCKIRSKCLNRILCNRHPSTHLFGLCPHRHLPLKLHSSHAKCWQTSAHASCLSTFTCGFSQATYLLHQSPWHLGHFHQTLKLFSSDITFSRKPFLTPWADVHSTFWVHFLYHDRHLWIPSSVRGLGTHKQGQGQGCWMERYPQVGEQLPGETCFLRFLSQGGQRGGRLEFEAFCG